MVVAEADFKRVILDAFRVMDADASGFISVSELRSSLEGLGEVLSAQEIEDIFNEFDADKDGQLGYEEFVQIMIRR